MNEHQTHKVFRGADREALEPWISAYGLKLKAINSAFAKALNFKAEHREITIEEVLMVLLGENPAPVTSNLEVCPSNLLMLPTLLRDVADMVEDLAVRIGIKQLEPWTPNKDNS